MMARTKQTMRKASKTDPHFAWLFAAARVEQAKPPSKDEVTTGGEIEVQEVEDHGEICTAGLRSGAQKILQLLESAQNISFLAIEANFIWYGLYPSDEVQEPEQATEEVAGRGKAMMVEDEEEDSFDENTPSLLVQEGAPVDIYVGENVACYKEEDMRFNTKRSLAADSSNILDVIPKVVPLTKKNAKYEASTTSTKNSKGANTKGPKLPRSLATPPILHPETKKGKEMLIFYQDCMMPEVNEQLTRAKEIPVKLLVGGVLKEVTQLTYTYSRPKYAALKATTTIGELKKALEDAKKKAEQKNDFYDFWKVNLEANFDYLKGDLRTSFFDFYEAQKAKEEERMADKDSSSTQEHENPAAEDSTVATQDSSE
uniref:Uncharacterized protein n=1 Tax=Cannabis sativa TaxID=3483 RepID=A0A803QE68_CANSA